MVVRYLSNELMWRIVGQEQSPSRLCYRLVHWLVRPVV